MSAEQKLKMGDKVRARHDMDIIGHLYPVRIRALRDARITGHITEIRNDVGDPHPIRVLFSDDDQYWFWWDELEPAEPVAPPAPASSAGLITDLVMPASEVVRLHEYIAALEAALAQAEAARDAAVSALKPFGAWWNEWRALAHTGDMEVSFLEWLSAEHFDAVVAASKAAALAAAAPDSGDGRGNEPD